jgi:hypothetical protein
LERRAAASVARRENDHAIERGVRTRSRSDGTHRIGEPSRRHDPRTAAQPQLHAALEAFAQQNSKGSSNYNILFQKYLRNTGYVNMQIKPATAAGPPINIGGVDASAEKVIEAGAKYLRFIIDEYYKNEPMDRLNKGLFATASYNAGPARIARLRAKAQRLGLDPNKWFANVETVAARDIGRETVTYVSNIYKYYVSYNLVMAQTAERRRGRSGSGKER